MSSYAAVLAAAARSRMATWLSRYGGLFLRRSEFFFFSKFVVVCVFFFFFFGSRGFGFAVMRGFKVCAYFVFGYCG